LVKLGHDIRYGIADAWDFREGACRCDPVEGLGESRKAVGRPKIGFRPVWVAAAQVGAGTAGSESTLG
jgi:hypothetical protein